jgi:hypothetical protein
MTDMAMTVSGNNNVVLAGQHGDWKVGLTGFRVLPGRVVGYDGYRELLSSAVRVGGVVNWVVGDILNAAEVELGEEWVQMTADLSEVLESHGWSSQRIANVKWVSSRWPQADRLPEMSWTHHAHLAANSDKVEMLRLAADEGWSSKQLYELLRSLRQGVPAILPNGTSENPNVPIYDDYSVEPPLEPSNVLPPGGGVVAETVWRIVRVDVGGGRTIVGEYGDYDSFRYDFERIRGI